MGEGKAGFGTTIKIGDTTIGEMLRVTPPVRSRGSVQITHMQSADSYREFAAGIKDGGEVTFLCNLYPGDAGQTALETAFEAGSTDVYTITFPSGIGATFTFSAFITGAPVQETNYDDNAVTVEFTVKVTGKPTFGTTASDGLSALSVTGAGGTLAPAFDAALRYYTYDSVSATSVTITPTAALHTIKLYVNGVFVENVTSGAASSAIALVINVSKLAMLICYAAAKSPITYYITLLKTS